MYMISKRNEKINYIYLLETTKLMRISCLLTNPPFIFDNAQPYYHQSINQKIFDIALFPCGYKALHIHTAPQCLGHLYSYKQRLVTSQRSVKYM